MRRKPHHQVLVLDADRAPDIQRQAIVASGTVLREPRVETTRWADPSDTGAAARMRGAKQIEGDRVVWQIERLHRSSPNRFTAQHVKAATRLVHDMEMASSLPSCLDNSRGGDGKGGVSDARMNAETAVRRAKEAVGASAFTTLVIVVFNNRPIVALSKQLRVNPDQASGMFLAALERLREHYSPPGRGIRPVQDMDERSYDDVDPSTGLPFVRSARVAR